MSGRRARPMARWPKWLELPRQPRSRAMTWSRLAVSVEGQVGIEPRGTRRRAMGRKAGARQNAGDGAVMDAKLAGDGARPPLLDVALAQDLCFELSRDGHGKVLLARGRRRPDGGARSRGGPALGSGGGTNDSAKPRAARCRSQAARSGPPSSPPQANHRLAAEGNPDASRSCIVPGSARRARHDSAGRRGSADSAAPPRAENAAALPARSPRRSRSGRDRNSGTPPPPAGSGRTRRAGTTARRHRGNRQDLDEPWNQWDIAPACVLGTVWGTATVRTGQIGIGAAPASSMPRVLLRPSARSQSVSRAAAVDMWTALAHCPHAHSRNSSNRFLIA
jgi:hypothetical protein